MVDGLKELNENMKAMPGYATQAGTGLRVLFGEQARIALRPRGTDLFSMFSFGLDPVSLAKNYDLLKKNLFAQDRLSKETLDKRVKEAKIRAKTEETETKTIIYAEKERKEHLRHTIALMKAMGASAAQALSKELELTEEIVDEDERKISQLELLNKQLEIRGKFIKKIADITREQAVSLAEAAGLDELSIAKDRLRYAYSLNNAEEKHISILSARNNIEKAYLNILLDEKKAMEQNTDVLEKLLNLSKKFGKKDIAKELIEFTLGRKTFEKLSSDAQKAFPKYFPEQTRQRDVRKGIGELFGEDFEEEIRKYRKLDSTRADRRGKALGESLTHLPELKVINKHLIEMKIEAIYSGAEKLSKSMADEVRRIMEDPKIISKFKAIAIAQADVAFENKK